MEDAPLIVFPHKVTPSLLPNNLHGNGEYLVYAHKNQVVMIKADHDNLMKGSPVVSTAAYKEAEPVTVARFVKLELGWCLVVINAAGVMHVYDGSGQKLLHVYQNKQPLQVTAVASDGATALFAGSEKGDVHLFRVSSQSLELEATAGGEHKTAVTDLAWTSAVGESGARVAYTISADETGTVVFWSSEKNKLEKCYRQNGVGDPISSLAVAGDLCITADTTGLVKIYDVVKMELVASLAAHTRAINAIAANAQRGMFATVSEDTFVQIWELQRKGTLKLKLLSARRINNALLCGAQFCGAQGCLLGLTSYDNKDILFLPVFK